MKENINLIGGLLGHVVKHVSKTCQMCDMKRSNGWTLMVVSIVEQKYFNYLYLDKLANPTKKKPKLSMAML